MNRNSVSRFSLAPQVSIERSTLNRSCRKLASQNVGSVVPVFMDEVLPGDTFKVKTSKVVRMQTLKTPMLDDIELDVYWFYCPSRILWSHFPNFLGENTESAWIPETEYSIPQITAPSGGWQVGTIADYLGIPPLVSGISVNALPFRGYAKIMEDWFRSTPVQDPIVIPNGDSTVVGSNGDNYITDTAKGGMPFTANRYHDYFSSCLPSPQYGESSKITLAQEGTLPVYAIGNPNEHFWSGKATSAARSAYVDAVNAAYPVMYETKDAPGPSDGASNWVFPKIFQAEGPISNDKYGLLKINGQTSSPYETFLQSSPGMSGVTNYGYDEINLGHPTAFTTNQSGLTPVNLVADFSGNNALAYTTINELRQAFQIQRWMEKTARSGNRMTEILHGHFGVTSPDARLQRSEYLGGNRVRLNIRQITQTSSTTETSPMGDVAGMSVTTDTHYDFEKSFVEHGYLFGLACARYKHTYQQGIPREFLRRTKWDFYWPSLAHLGETAVYNSQLYAQGDSHDSEVFGYQEAWAEYRYKPNTVSGMLRTVSNSGLDSWHLADYYTELPYLSADWLKEDKTNVDRVLAVTSDVSDQLFFDFYFDCKATRCMPLYSIPGLIDHF